MNKITKILVTMMLVIACSFCLVACDGESTEGGNPEGGNSQTPDVDTNLGVTDAHPSISMGFKSTAAAGNYDESIDAFEIGKPFYVCIKVKVKTDKQEPKPYKVIVEVPNSAKDIVVDQNGGISPSSKNSDTVNGVTRMVFVIAGSKDAVDSTILFKGTPIRESSAKINIKITTEGDEKITGGNYFRIVDFVYEVQ